MTNPQNTPHDGGEGDVEGLERLSALVGEWDRYELGATPPAPLSYHEVSTALANAASAISKLIGERDEARGLLADQSRRIDAWQQQASENDTRALEAEARAQAAEQEIGELREGLKGLIALFGDMWSKTHPGVESRAIAQARALLSRGGSGEGNSSASSTHSGREDAPSSGPHSAGGEP